MKPTALCSLLACGLPLAAGLAARAQDLPDATRTVSREVTLFLPAEGQQATGAASRELTLYIPAEGAASSRAASREVSMFIPAGALETLAASREVTARFRHSLADAIAALRVAAGLQPSPPASAWEFRWLDAINSPATAAAVELPDAIAIARDAM